VQGLHAKDRRSEDELLRFAGRRRTGAWAGAPLDWDYVFASAEQQGVIPLVFEKLGSGNVPAYEVDRWVDACSRMQQGSAALASELGKIFRLFATAGIPALTYRGPALELQISRQLGMREFNGLNIVLHPGDLAKAEALLRGEGYRPAYTLRSGQEKALAHFRGFLRL